jgi:hypothetical protein
MMTAVTVTEINRRDSINGYRYEDADTSGGVQAVERLQQQRIAWWRERAAVDPCHTEPFNQTLPANSGLVVAAA